MNTWILSLVIVCAGTVIVLAALYLKGDVTATLTMRGFRIEAKQRK